MARRPVVLAALVVAAVAAVLLLTWAIRSPVDPTAGPATTAVLATDGAGRPSASGFPAPVATSAGLPGPPPASSAPPTADPDREMLPVVPVVGFWSSYRTISLDELRGAIAGDSTEFRRVIAGGDDVGPIAEALAVMPGPSIETGNPAQIRAAVRDGALGVMRLTDVTPAVRALEIDGVGLFGNDRLANLADWPLRVPVVPGEQEDFAQAATWTLVAGGDIQLDRWMAYHVTVLGKGVDWPWDGGAVEITGRYCCSRFGHRVPEWRSTGDDGVVKRLLSDADLAAANLEAAAVDDPAEHTLPAGFEHSLDFSGNPRLLRGLERAGFDFLSLANNHIHNGGADGIRDTRRALREFGIAFAGAGRNLAQAARAEYLSVDGRTIAVLPCASVGRMAGPSAAGAAPCEGEGLVDQIADAERWADVVILFPHWGREYTTEPGPGQRALARAWTAEGADVVLGAHSHWAGAIEEFDGALVFYSMGNLAFDQPWSETTMQGVIVELTFHRQELVQVALHPTLIVDDVQPNLLELDGGGERVLERMRKASDGLLPY